MRDGDIREGMPYAQRWAVMAMNQPAVSRREALLVVSLLVSSMLGGRSCYSGWRVIGETENEATGANRLTYLVVGLCKGRRDSVNRVHVGAM